MRLNRNIRIGATIVALCLLLLGVTQIFQRLRPSQPTQAGPVGEGTPSPAGTATPVPVSMVAVAREDIPERSIVTPEMLVMRAAPAGFDTASFVTNSNSQAVGFITSRPIAAGRDVRRADLLGHISDVGIAGALLPGRRAMIIPIGNKATLHDLVRIGDRVDITASFDQQEARVIAEDVRVLAVDVFGSDYPQVKIAMRGDYKAPAGSLSVAVPASPPAAPATGDSPANGTPANPDAPAGQQPQANAPAAPEATPTEGPPPARPESALTIEVTPQQATDIALTQSAGQNIDFLLRSRSEPRLATGEAGADGITLASGTTRSAAFTTRDRLAPNAARAKRAGSNAGSGNSSAGGNRARGNSGSSESAASARRRLAGSQGSDYTPPSLPDVPPVSSIPPAKVSGATTVEAPAAPAPPAPYDIPIYGDGKLMRVDTVKRPRQ